MEKKMPIRLLALPGALAAVIIACGILWRDAHRDPRTGEEALATRGQVKALALARFQDIRDCFPGHVGYVWAPKPGRPAAPGYRLMNLMRWWAPRQALGYGPPGPKPQPADGSPITIGELKMVAKIFYDRLAEAGFVGKPLKTGEKYPWDGAAFDDFAMAPASLASEWFGFDVRSGFEADGIPDWWQLKYFSRAGHNAREMAPSGIGLTLGQCCENGVNPVEYKPKMTIVNGGGQTGAPGALLEDPLVVHVTDGHGVPIIGAPVTFDTTAGELQSNDFLPLGKLPVVVRTNADGNVVLQLLAPKTAGTAMKISVATGGPANPVELAVSESSDDGKRKPAEDEEGDNITASLNDDGSVDVSWTDNSKHPNGTPIKIRMPDGTWARFTAPAGAYHYHIPAQ